MTFIRFKVHCNHSASEDVEMDLVEEIELGVKHSVRLFVKTPVILGS